jgi:hypothetical protein
MLSYLDPVIFPDDIEVLEVSPSRYVYPIFKNGSRSLASHQYRPLSKSEISDLAQVEIFVRDPFERYVSGVQTYLRLHSELDRTTTLQLINNYLFLDRHFTLQFHWLVNLRRFCNPKIHIRPMAELGSVTDVIWNSVPRDQTLVDYFQPNLKLWYYLQLDKILTEDFLNQTVKISTILEYIKINYPDLQNEIISRVQNICVVLD